MASNATERNVQTLIALSTKTGVEDRKFLRRVAVATGRREGRRVLMGECVMMGLRLLAEKNRKASKRKRRA